MSMFLNGKIKVNFDNFKVNDVSTRRLSRVE